MTGILAKLAGKLVKGKWGAILPALLRAAAEGSFGEPVKRAYWWAAGKKTVTGAILLAAGAGLEVLAAAHPEWAWTSAWAGYVFTAGSILAAVGLVDGGVRSPWPTGTQIPQEAKRG